MDTFISQKFRFFTFISLTAVVFIHGYNLHDRYLQPFSIVEEPLTITTFIEYWFANGLSRFIIPLFFIMSGYLFALKDEQPYKLRMRKRLKTLLFPYLIWSGVALLITYGWQSFPATSMALKDAQLDQLGDNRPYWQMGWMALLLRWTLFPIAFQLWFIRSLLIYNAAYPLILKAINKFPAVWFGICTFLWVVTFGTPLIEGEGVLFFSLGIYIQKTNFDINTPSSKLSLRYWLPIFLLASILKTILAFHLHWGIISFIILSLLHKITVIAGLITVWYGSNSIVSYCMKRSWFVWLTSFSFIIYVIHVPLINYSLCFAYRYFPSSIHNRLLLFILLPVSIIAFTIIVGAIFRFLSPKLYSICTGERGV